MPQIDVYVVVIMQHESVKFELSLLSLMPLNLEGQRLATRKTKYLPNCQSRLKRLKEIREFSILNFSC